ncbi:MAG: putative glycolipid-binding domain-containing protein [Actinomycetota bacterium]
MPAGTYTIIGDDGEPVGTEVFRCAPGPMGWRYFSEIDTAEHGQHHETVDVVVDADWRIARVRIDTGAHRLLLEPTDAGLTGWRDGHDLIVPWTRDDHLDYLTPATNLITTRRLTLSTELEVVFLEPFELTASHDLQRYVLHGDEAVETPVGRFEATRWTYTSIESGWTADLWVAGDVVVRYDRLFELVAYDPGANGPRPLG